MPTATQHAPESAYRPPREAGVLALTMRLLFAAFALETAFALGIREGAADLRVKAALLQTLGLSSLAASAECKASRSMTEGLCGCLGDVPGGYCYHTSCDIVGAPRPRPEDLYSVEVTAQRQEPQIDADWRR